MHHAIKRILLSGILMLSLPFAGTAQTPQNIAEVLEAVNIDSMMQTVAHLSGHTPFVLNGKMDSLWTRYTFSPQIYKAQDYLEDRLTRLGYAPLVDEYTAIGKVAGMSLTALCQGWPPSDEQAILVPADATGKAAMLLHNVIAEKTGTLHPEKIYILCGHYDSIVWIDGDPSSSYNQAPGADDNATGVATVIEAARLLRDVELPYTVRFILFSGEERGLYGSRHYAGEARGRGDQILGVLNVDMIGYHHGLTSPLYTQIHTGDYNTSNALGQRMADNAEDWGLQVIPEIKARSNASWSSDHSPFWSEGYTAIFVSEDWLRSRNPFYHTVYDKTSTLNNAYFTECARMIIGTLAELNGMDNQTGITEPVQLPIDFALAPPFPNPFNPQVTIPWTQAQSSRVRITIHNVLGQTVSLLNDAPMEAGAHARVWNGCDAQGRPMPTGVYFVRASTGRSQVMRKIILSR